MPRGIVKIAAYDFWDMHHYLVQWVLKARGTLLNFEYFAWQKCILFSGGNCHSPGRLRVYCCCCCICCCLAEQRESFWQGNLVLQLSQWFQFLFRCRIELLNFWMGFNIGGKREQLICPVLLIMFISLGSLRIARNKACIYKNEFAINYSWVHNSRLTSKPYQLSVQVSNFKCLSFQQFGNFWKLVLSPSVYLSWGSEHLEFSTVLVSM